MVYLLKDKNSKGNNKKFVELFVCLWNEKEMDV